jgi:hypothetical protein
VEQKERAECPLLRRTELERPALLADLERAEDSELELGAVGGDDRRTTVARPVARA